MYKSEGIVVSVVITTHNRVDLLKKAIESVKEQTHKNIECFIVDDASDYDIEPFIKDVIDKRFNIVKIKSTETKGGNYARNLGISKCSGEYVAFLDDDDMWLPDKIEKQVNYLQEYPNVGLVYCGRTFCYSGGIREVEILDMKNQGDCSKRIFYNIIATTSSIMVRNDLLNNNKFDEELKFWQEYDLLIRLCQVTQVGVINQPLVEYLINQNDVNRKTNKYDEWLEAVQYITEKYKSLISELSDEENSLRILMIDYDTTHRLYAAGRKKERRKVFWKMYRNTKGTKHFVKFLLNWDRNDTVNLKQKLSKNR